MTNQNWGNALADQPMNGILGQYRRKKVELDAAFRQFPDLLFRKRLPQLRELLQIGH